MKHWRSLLFLLAFILILFQREAGAESIPLLIPYSGTVASGGTPFNGNGQFKFAIVNKDCTLNPVAPTCATLWSNDNTLGAGVEPAAAATIPVTNGAFSVKLGDTTLTGMLTVPTTVFNNPETFLRVWFNDGVNGSQQLSPDRQLVSVPYAYHAETASSVTGTAVVGTNQIANEAVTSTQIANGTISGTDISSSTSITIADLTATGAIQMGGGKLIVRPSAPCLFPQRGSFWQLVFQNTVGSLISEVILGTVNGCFSSIIIGPLP